MISQANFGSGTMPNTERRDISRQLGSLFLVRPRTVFIAPGNPQMPNGKIGDHPYTDIIVHGRRTYSSRADELIREIASLADEKTRRELADLLLFEYNELSKPNVAKLERYLTDLRDRLLQDARSRGFEVPDK
jgi:hypothetical protein